MTKHYELARDPSKPVEYFPTTRTYTREQPNALKGEQMPLFLATMKERHPEHYAMTFLGFVIGARPSTLRPLRRSGPESDVLWDEGVVLLRRSNAVGDEIGVGDELWMGGALDEHRAILARMTQLTFGSSGASAGAPLASCAWAPAPFSTSRRRSSR